MSFSTYLRAALLLLAGYLPFAAQAQTFANGADISWVTEMEASNYKFYNKAGAQQDLFQLLQSDYGINAIRLRVWVNPSAGYSGQADVLAKALRAKALGQRILLDFHYSDSFADPGKQTKPAAWAGYTYAQLKQAVYSHTTTVLTLLSNNGITPEWVQVGNETNDGMLWPEGRITVNGFANFAGLVDQGYAAVKAVSPTSKVIVHIANGYNNSAFRYIFDGLQANGARWDVIGLSLYPDAQTWPTYTAQAQANMNDMVSRYPGKQVMVVEVGMPAYLPIATREFLYDIIAKTKAVPGSAGLGVFYWEPEAYNWQGYSLGAWATTGYATVAMDGFLAQPTPPLVYNPGFEYSAATQNPLGWTTTSAADASADYTETGGHSSQFRLTHYKATAYAVTTSQSLNSLPSGTYTLSAWAQSGGGQTTCQLYAQPFGSTAQALTLPATTTWTAISIPGIMVTNGQLEIGLRSVAAAGNYCSLDDVVLVRTGALATVAATLGSTAELYPNPTTGVFALQGVSASLAAGPAELYSLTGQRLAVLPVTGTQELLFSLPAGLPAGLYLLRLGSGPGQLTRKVVKQ
ncbi:MAG: glycosyl hydrolase 53 family protein [Janthinobacterium lividum]